MIKTKDLAFNYDNQVFFKFPNINLKSNEDLLIIGSSGIGKTTLLHLLAGLLNSNSGSIELFGKELNQLSSHQLDRFRKNNIGIVFQRPHFVNSLTVRSPFLNFLSISIGRSDCINDKFPKMCLYNALIATSNASSSL